MTSARVEARSLKQGTSLADLKQRLHVDPQRITVASAIRPREWYLMDMMLHIAVGDDIATATYMCLVISSEIEAEAAALWPDMPIDRNEWFG